ncbi:MAG: type II secretion system protein [Kiritimatiellae bacterium]|nr:type II secretion system protein [Kiritimatiellia bacterium]
MAGGRGFTLVEIMIVVAIIGLLSAMAIPSFVKSRRDSQITKIVSDLDTFHDAFSVYATEHGKHPPPAGVGAFPPEMTGYIREKDWAAGVITGGTYGWIFLNAVSQYVIYVDAGPDPVIMQEVDARLDDGDLATGLFRQGNGQNYFYIVQ